MAASVTTIRVSMVPALCEMRAPSTHKAPLAPEAGTCSGARHCRDAPVVCWDRAPSEENRPCETAGGAATEEYGKNDTAQDIRPARTTATPGSSRDGAHGDVMPLGLNRQR
jgi:hypothetical protein